MVARLVPVVRIFISVPAGVFAMDWRRFVLFTAIGDAIWISLLTSAGYLLRARYEQVAAYLNPVSTVVLTIVFGTYLVRALAWNRK
jgi:membrane protein DedA with SNARE-associated domain